MTAPSPTSNIRRSSNCGKRGVGSREWGMGFFHQPPSPIPRSPLPTPHSPMARKFIIKSDAPRASLINYREALNEEQRAVVGAGAGPILVIAGAGSGKTRTVTYRVARLIEAGVAPGRIMLVTFTNRAAREMLGRVESLLGHDVQRVWGGTFHSIGNRLLRRHAVSLGYENNFSILDAEDAKDLIDTCIEEAAIDTRARRFPKGEVLREMFSFSTNTDVPLDQTIAAKYPHFELLTAQIKRLDALYQQRKLE